MKIDLEFVELHQPLFLAGVNFGTKLYPVMKGGIKMWYDTELDHTIVCYNGKVAMIENTASKTMYDPSQLGINTKAFLVERPKLVQTDAIPTTWAGAQVETPASKPPKTIRRPAKIQGEEAPE